MQHCDCSHAAQAVYRPDDGSPSFGAPFRADDGDSTPRPSAWQGLAAVRTRSPEFAETPRLQQLLVRRANGSEPERTPTAAIAAIVTGATFGGPNRRQLPEAVEVARRDSDSARRALKQLPAGATRRSGLEWEARSVLAPILLLF